MLLLVQFYLIKIVWVKKNNNIYYISFYLNNEEEDYNYFKMDNEKWNISHQGKIFLEGNKNFNISLSLY